VSSVTTTSTPSSHFRLAASPRALDLGATAAVLAAGSSRLAARPRDPIAVDRGRGRFTRESTSKKFSIRPPRRTGAKVWGPPNSQMSLGPKP
jgi:hypothetical protein